MRGDVTFEVEGVQYRMVLDFNALCDVETVLGEGVKMTGPTATRAVIWAGLQRHHSVTIAETGDLIGAMGMARAAALVSEAMTAGGLLGGEESADPPRQKTRASKAR